jgi:hypothetical protein
MKKSLQTRTIAACLFLTAMPVVVSAQTDPNMLTCSEFNSMSDEDKIAAVVEMQQVSNDSSANVTASPSEALDATKKACLANPKVNTIEAMAMMQTWF